MRLHRLPARLCGHNVGGGGRRLSPRRRQLLSARCVHHDRRLRGARRRLPARVSRQGGRDVAHVRQEQEAATTPAPAAAAAGRKQQQQQQQQQQPSFAQLECWRDAGSARWPEEQRSDDHGQQEQVVFALLARRPLARPHAPLRARDRRAHHQEHTRRHLASHAQAQHHSRRRRRRITGHATGDRPGLAAQHILGVLVVRAGRVAHSLRLVCAAQLAAQDGHVRRVRPRVRRARSCRRPVAERHHHAACRRQQQLELSGGCGETRASGGALCHLLVRGRARGRQRGAAGRRAAARLFRVDGEQAVGAGVALELQVRPGRQEARDVRSRAEGARQLAHRGRLARPRRRPHQGEAAVLAQLRLRRRALRQLVQLLGVLRGVVRGRPRAPARPQRDHGRLRPPLRRAALQERREDQVHRLHLHDRLGPQPGARRRRQQAPVRPGRLRSRAQREARGVQQRGHVRLPLQVPDAHRLQLRPGHGRRHRHRPAALRHLGRHGQCGLAHGLDRPGGPPPDAQGSGRAAQGHVHVLLSRPSANQGQGPDDHLLHESQGQQEVQHRRH